MKKPKIEIEEFGAMGPDGYMVIIDHDVFVYAPRRKKAEAVPEMIDALFSAFHNEKLHLKEWGYNTHEERMELEPYKSYYNALKKAGCTE